MKIFEYQSHQSIISLFLTCFLLHINIKRTSCLSILTQNSLMHWYKRDNPQGASDPSSFTTQLLTGNRMLRRRKFKKADRSNNNLTAWENVGLWIYSMASFSETQTNRVMFTNNIIQVLYPYILQSMSVLKPILSLKA